MTTLKQKLQHCLVGFIIYVNIILMTTITEDGREEVNGLIWFKDSISFMRLYNINCKQAEKLRMYIVISEITIKITQRDIAKKLVAKLKWSLKIFK